MFTPGCYGHLGTDRRGSGSDQQLKWALELSRWTTFRWISFLRHLWIDLHRFTILRFTMGFLIFDHLSLSKTVNVFDVSSKWWIVLNTMQNGEALFEPWLVLTHTFRLWKEMIQPRGFAFWRWLKSWSSWIILQQCIQCILAKSATFSSQSMDKLPISAVLDLEWTPGRTSSVDIASLWFPKF